MFVAGGSSRMRRTFAGFSPMRGATASGGSRMNRQAFGLSSMLVQIHPMNIIETGVAAVDLIEDGTQPDNIVETGKA